MGEVSIETMADSPSMAILTAAKDSEPASAVLPVASDAFFEDARADIVAGLHEGLATHMTHCEKIKNPYMHVAEGNKPYFHEGEFDRVGRGEVDIQYVSKDGCRFLGLWPFRGQPAVVCRSKEVCGLEAGRTVP